LGADEFKINSRVRGIFARHWIDTSKLSIVSVKGIVYLGGQLRKIAGASSQIKINEDLLDKIDAEIRRLKDVKRVTYRLDDWRRDDGKFVTHDRVTHVKDKKSRKLGRLETPESYPVDESP